MSEKSGGAAELEDLAFTSTENGHFYASAVPGHIPEGGAEGTLNCLEIGTAVGMRARDLKEKKEKVEEKAGRKERKKEVVEEEENGAEEEEEETAEDGEDDDEGDEEDEEEEEEEDEGPVRKRTAEEEV
ncbi:hypothetical protein STEG23_026265 [Scotinomys teguina]